MEENLSLHKMLLKDRQDDNLFDQSLNYAKAYLKAIDDRGVYPTEAAIKNLKHFEEALSNQPTNATEVLEMLNEYGAPATVAQMGGRYFGFVTGGAIPAALAAKTLATYWDQNSAMNVISPICSKLESVVEQWLIDIFKLPKQTVAGFVSGTSTANFCCLAAARYRLLKSLNWDINDKGLFNAPALRIVTGKHTHASILKVIGLLGFGKNNIEWVDVDDKGRIKPDLIPQLDDKTILILQAGNVNSGAFDAFSTIIEKANRANAWIHIDGAFGLWAAAVNQLKHLTEGMELASSWAVDGHKTLNTPYDCGIALCKDEEAMVSALHMSGAYLVLSDEKDGMFYTPEMSRRSRIIELWATLKNLGKNGIDEMILDMHKRAVQFAEAVQKIDGFKVLNEVVFNQVIVKCATDELTEQTIRRIQKDGKCWVGGSSWFGEKIIRVSVCSWLTSSEDIDETVTSFKNALAK